MRDLFLEIASTLKQNKLRTALTGFAVAWGIFMLIALIGAGNGLLNALLNNSGQLKHSMSLYGGGYTTKPYAGYEKGRYFAYDLQDVNALSGEQFNDVIDEVSPYISVSDTVSMGRNLTIPTDIMGVNPISRSIEGVQMIAGRFIDALDIKEKSKVIVMSDKDAKSLLDGRDPKGILGKNVDIGAFQFKVVGLFKTEENMGESEMYSPYPTIQSIYNTGTEISYISFSFHGLETEEENEAYEKKIKTMINTHHDAAPDDYNAIYIWNRYTSSLETNKATKIIRTALWILGLFTLVSGIVGVSNIMLITVKERTHEFGIRKAIGAKPWSILKLIIAESVTITTIFGYVGMILGLVANEVMNIKLGGQAIDLMGLTQIVMFLNPYVSVGTALKATLTLIIAGTIAGLIPAVKASKVRPIEALRSE